MTTQKNDIHGGNFSAIVNKLGLPKTSEIIYDFSVNINPFGIPLPIEREILGLTDSDFTDYPEVYAESAVKALADAHSCSNDSILIGNGSTELFSWITHTINPSKAHCIAPCYSGYSEVCKATGIQLDIAQFAKAEKDFAITLNDINYSNIELLFICSPNNPNGVTIPPNQIIENANKNPDTFFVVDESFIDFVPNNKSLFGIKQLPANIAVIKSLTKFFAIAGIRLGMVYANPKFIDKLKNRRLPWSVNAMAQTIASHLYLDKNYIDKTCKNICELRKKLSANLAKIENLKVYPSKANFLLCELKNSNSINSGTDLQKKLLLKQIFIRSCAKIDGLGDSFFRVAIKTEQENEILVKALRDTLLNIKSQNHKISKSPIMIVGTTSDAGKSVVAAALCRYFARKGVKVAPFKAQNMSLNSFVTKEGGEMGRAQVVQAEAAGIEPHTDMNPVLLKPTNELGSQLIVNGKPIGNVTAKGYYDEKRELRKDAQQAYDRLTKRFDMIILEGAGSPAEINLQNKDFVNMAMAEYANAKTILVADINLGGVFASIYGTIKLIPARQRKFLSGIIINKFRGDVSLLEQGIKEIEQLTNLPVLGVLPYLRNLNIEEEDSMALDTSYQSKIQTSYQSKTQTSCKSSTAQKESINIAIIRLPMISNFTDFLSLETSPGVTVRYVTDPRNLASSDLIIIPGSKNTISDMKFLRENGFENKLIEMRNSQTPIFGICGGFQILGETILDPNGIEGNIKKIKGLGFLPLATTLTDEKELSQVKGEVNNLPFTKKGTIFKGYEIHVGQTELKAQQQILNHKTKSKLSNPLLITMRKEKQCRELSGEISENGLIFGSYIHGLFDQKELRSQLFKWLAKRNPKLKNYKIENIQDIDKNKVYDRLANMIEKHIDLSDY